MTAPTSKSRRTISIGLAVLVVAVLAGGAVFLAGTSSPEKKDSESIHFLPPYGEIPTEAEADYVRLSRNITETETFQRYVSLRKASRSAETFPQLLELAEEIKARHPDSSFAHFLVGFTHYRNPMNSSKSWDEIRFGWDGLKEDDGTPPSWSGMSKSQYFRDLDLEGRKVSFDNWRKATRSSREEYSRTHTPHSLYLNKAKTSFEKAVELDPGNILALWHLGKTKEYLGLIEEALETLLSLIDASPKYNMGYIHTATHLHISGDIERAIEILKDGLVEIPHDYWITDALGEYLYETGSLQESKELLQAFLNASGDKSPRFGSYGIWETLAKIAEAQGNLERSEQIREQLKRD